MEAGLNGVDVVRVVAEAEKIDNVIILSFIPASFMLLLDPCGVDLLLQVDVPPRVLHQGLELLRTLAAHVAALGARNL